MATGVSSGYDAAEAARIRAEEEARRRAEEERRRKAEEERKAKEAEQAKQAEEEQRAQEEREQQEQEKTAGSVFGNDEQNDGLTTHEVQDYNTWIESLQARGLKTTSIGNGEANFQDYGNALSTELQQEILNSFDNDQDYVLQQQLASAFASGNFNSYDDIKSICSQMGISVSTDYVATTYIMDNKYDGNYNKTNAKNGHVTVYTFSDGKGGEIKIADANGNGGLETEELFVNEILTGIASDLQVTAGNYSKGSHGSHGSHGSKVTSAQSAEDILKNIFNNNSGKSFTDLLNELREFQEELKEEREENKKLQNTNKGKIQVTDATFNRLVKGTTNNYVESDMLQYSVAYQKALDEISEKYYV